MAEYIKVINNWYSTVLGVEVDVSKMSWNEEKRLEELVNRQMELEVLKGKEAFSKMSPSQQRKSNLQNRLMELAIEPMTSQNKPLRDVNNETLEKVLANLKNLIK